MLCVCGCSKYLHRHTRDMCFAIDCRAKLPCLIYRPRGR